MTDETKAAFQHPEERSLITSGKNFYDRISLRDYVRQVEIGAFHAERGQVQGISFNIVLEVDLPKNPDDDVDQIISYDTLISAIDVALSVERINLLETLAERVSENILSDPRAVRVFIRIEKLDRGPGLLGVEIVRCQELKSLNSKPLSNSFIVIFLDEETIKSERLSEVITLLTRQDYPVVISLSDYGFRSKTLNKAAQKRVDLLSLDQNAWTLSGFDERCKVVETRTELEWAINDSQLIVWSPSRIVLSSEINLELSNFNSSELTEWFAKEFGAEGIFSIGDNPQGPGLHMTIDEALNNKKLVVRIK
ncbi:MAG: dihydroneopterin aldolase [Paracoccaceae bacterium]|jgi:dihydroneopterin aldolase